MELSEALETGVLKPIGPFHEDVLKNGYRACDFCFESACEDIWNGIPDEDKWRKFYFSESESLTVCEHCLGEILDG